MKPIQFLTYLFFGVVAAATATASDYAHVYPQSGNVTIAYIDPHSFTDLESVHSKDSNTRKEFARSIDEELERRLRASFDVGTKLEITITEVDLAGRINPAAVRSVRVLKSVWPPKMEFTYKFTDADGFVIAEGEERLVDLGYLGFAGTQPRHENFRYEREMVKDWLRGLSRELNQ